MIVPNFRRIYLTIVGTRGRKRHIFPRVEQQQPRMQSAEFSSGNFHGGRSGGKIANQAKNRASASSSPLRIRNRTRKERVSCVPSADIRVLESDTDTGRTCRDENSFAPRSPASSPRASSFSRRRRFQGKIAIFQPLSTRRPIPPRYILINVATKVWNAYRKCWNERFKKKRRKKIGSSRKYAEYSAMSGARISRAIGI